MVIGNESIVLEQELYDFVVCCMEVVGINMEYVDVLVDLIVVVDIRGYYSYGFNRLGKIRWLLQVQFYSYFIDIKFSLFNKRYNNVYFLIYILINLKKKYYNYLIII